VREILKIKREHLLPLESLILRIQLNPRAGNPVIVKREILNKSEKIYCNHKLVGERASLIKATHSLASAEGVNRNF